MPRCEDNYCDKPQPYGEKPTLHQSEKFNRFAPQSSLQFSLISYEGISAEGDGLADNYSDNDIGSDDDGDGGKPCGDINFNFNEVNIVGVDVSEHVQGNKSNDNDTIDVKDNLKDIGNDKNKNDNKKDADARGPSGSGGGRSDHHGSFKN